MTDNQKARAWDALKKAVSRVALDQSASEKDRDISAVLLAMFTVIESHVLEIDERIGGQDEGND